MKELSIEQKAKAYDKAIKVATALYKASEPMSGCNVIIETIFPELKESEDERIRKNLIGYIKGISKNEVCEETKDSWIAWLEIQGKKDEEILVLKDQIESLHAAIKAIKNVHKIEPKFKVGDKIQYLKGCGTIMTIEKIENDEYIFANNLGHTTIEDGNKWYLVECNPTWSEEDVEIIEALISLCDVAKDNIPQLSALKNWLKSLKDRVLPQPKQEWSEEDEDILNTIINHFEIDLECNENDDIIRWLKSLRPQNRWKPSDEQIGVIEAVINNRSFQKRHLDSLYEQLKILKGE